MSNTDATVGALARDFDTLAPSATQIATTPFSFFTLTASNATSGGVLLFALLLGLLIEQRKIWAGQAPTWSTPILRLILFTALLASYNLLATSLMQGVLSLGSLDPSGVESTSRTLLASRAAAFAEVQAKFQGDNAALNLVGAGLSTFMEALLNLVTAGSFVFAAAIVFVLKIVQGIMFKVLFIVGPLMIGVAAIPHPSTAKYLEGWIVAIVEVGLWGFIGKIFLGAMASGWNSTNLNSLTDSGTMNFFELIVFNIVYALAFTAIPVMSAIIVRGASSSGVGGSAVSAAMGAAMASGAFAKSAAGGAADTAKAFTGGGGGGGQGGGGGGGASTARAGDAPASSDAPLGGSDPAAARRAAFARDGAIKKQERKGDD